MLGIDSHILSFSPSGQNRMVQIPQGRFRGLILLKEEILHQLICSLSHYLQGFKHPRWYRISSINSMDCLPCSFSIRCMFFFKDELMTKVDVSKAQGLSKRLGVPCIFLLDGIEPANLKIDENFMATCFSIKGSVLSKWKVLPSLKLTGRPWIWWFPIGISFSRGLFSGSMLVSRRVNQCMPEAFFPELSSRRYQTWILYHLHPSKWEEDVLLFWTPFGLRVVKQLQGNVE